MNTVKYLLRFAWILVFFSAKPQGAAELIIEPGSSLLSNNQSYNKIARDRIVIKPGISYAPSSSNVFFKATLDETIIAPFIPASSASISVKSTLNTSLEAGGSAINCDVNGIGQATSSIPIQVPPGTAGMQPQLSVVYQSQQESGILGYGWDVSGMSSISRTGRDIFHDNEARTVHFDGWDNFSLDGQRLIYTGGTYETEARSYSEIESHGWVGDGPDWFSVKTKNGTYMEFGNTPDSKILASGGAIMSWRLNKVMDANGNYIRYKYITVGTESVIQKIEYTGNDIAGITPYNYIQFYYDTKPDASSKWVNGVKIKNSFILRQIKTYAEGSLTKTYSFKYGKDIYTKLIEVDEIGASGERYNPIKISWNTPATAVSTPAQSYNLPILAKGDFDGDGRTDLVLHNYDATSNQFLVKLSRRDPINIPYSYTGTKVPSIIAMDLNGNDNIDEIYVYEKETGTFKAFRYNSTTLFQPISNAVTSYNYEFPCGSSPVNNSYVRLNKVVLDGDYLNTAIVLSSICDDPSSPGKDEALSTPFSGTNLLPASLKNITDHVIKFMDVNANGSTDIIQIRKIPLGSIPYSKTQIDIYEYSSQSGSFQNILSLPDMFGQEDYIDFGDFNGDGYIDILSHCSKAPYSSNKSWYTFTFNGLTFNSGILMNSLDQQMADYLSVVVGDFDGDGKSDIICNPYSAPPTVSAEMQKILKTIIKPQYLTPSTNYQAIFNRITNNVINPYQNAIDNLPPATFTYNFDYDVIEELRQYFKPNTFSSDYSMFKDGSNVVIKSIGFNKLKQYVISKHNLTLDSRKQDWWDKFQSSIGLGTTIVNWACPMYVYGNPNLILYRSNGATFEASSLSIQDLQGLQESVIADFNGDGNADLYANLIDDSFADKYKVLLFNSGKPAHAVNWIADGLNNYYNFTYIPITGEVSQTNQVYSINPTMPITGHFGLFVAPLYVVKHFFQTNAVNEQYIKSYTYSYQNAIYHKYGKGFLGFRVITRTDSKSFKSDYSEITQNNLNEQYAFLYPASTIKRMWSSSEDGQTLESNEYLYNFDQDSSSGHTYSFRPTKQTNYNALTGITSITEFIDYDWGGNLVKHKNYFLNSGTITTTENSYTFTNNSSVLNSISQQKVTKQRDNQSDIVTITDFSYDSKGNLRESISYNESYPNRTITNSYEYNLFGLVKHHTTSSDDESQWVNYVYDEKGRFVIEERNILNQRVTKTYDARFGLLLTNEDIDGKSAQYVYNGLGRLIKSTDKRGVITTYYKNWVSTSPSTSTFQEYSVTANTPILKDFYDNYGRKTKSTLTKNGTTLQTTYEYDGTIIGLLIKESKPFVSTAGKYVIYTYDVYNRVVNISDDNRNTETSYGIIGSKTTTTTVKYSDNSQNQIYSTTIGNDGMIESKTDNGGTISYIYQADGKPRIITTGITSTFFVYDELGNQTLLQDQNAGETFYDYNGLGTLREQTNPDGNKIALQYDIAGRISKRILNANNPDIAQTTVYTYVPSGNGINQIQSISDGQITQSFVYDEWGNPTSVTETIDGVNYTTSMTYDGNGRQIGITYPSGFGVLNEYDNIGRVAVIRRADNNQPVWQAGQYNEYDMLTRTIIGNGFTCNYSYDANKVLTGMSMKTASDTYLYNQAYLFDYTSGNIVWKKDLQKFVSGTQDPFTEEYEYDNLNRLTQVKVNGLVQMGLTYEPNGNIKTKTDISDNIWGYDSYKTNAVTYIDGLKPDIMIPSFNQTYQYNAANRITQIVDYYAYPYKTLNFVYGPDDERRKTTYTYDSTTTEHIYVGSYEKEIKDGQIKEYHYIYTPTGLAAIMIKTGSTQKMYYTCTDYLGNIQALVNENGTIAEEYNYDAWGQRRNPTDWTYNNVTLPTIQYRGFTGHEHLDEFGLINMNARLYDPVIGRMLSPDNYVQAPDYTQSYNRYSYAWNNPTNYTDPDGNLVFLGLPLLFWTISAFTTTSAAMVMTGHTGAQALQVALPVAALVGTLGLTTAIATSSTMFANTSAIMFNSMVYSSARSIASGMQSDYVVGFGAGSYNLSKNQLGYLGKKGNSAAENWGYALGALANLRDINQLINSTDATLYTQERYDNGSKDKISHSGIVDNETGNSLMSFGPNSRGHIKGKLGFALEPRLSTSNYDVPVSLSKSIDIAVNKHSFILTKGLAKILPYQGLTINCVNMASLSLWLNGIPNIGIHPYLLHYSVLAYNSGFRPDLYSYYLQQR